LLPRCHARTPAGKIGLLSGAVQVRRRQTVDLDGTFATNGYIRPLKMLPKYCAMQSRDTLMITAQPVDPTAKRFNRQTHLCYAAFFLAKFHISY